MKSNAQRRLSVQASRPAYRSLKGWALGALLEHHATRNASIMVTSSTAPIRTREPALARPPGIIPIPVPPPRRALLRSTRRCAPSG